MPCFFPLEGFRSRTVNPSGKRSIVFNVAAGFRDLPVVVPCGQCVGCRLERSRQWAMRLMHEASLHEDKCFVTLTYDEAHLPSDGSLHKKHFQDFMKRLRKVSRARVRFFHCGEYGDLTRRPHYHAILFGVDFPDKVRLPGGKVPLYRSALLSRLWPFGFCTIGAVTFESAAYVARYVMKKVTGDAAAGHYRRVDLDTGEIHQLAPEYCTMSLKPAIAKDWYSEFKDDVLSSDSVVMRGLELRPPRYYDKLHEEVDRRAHARVKRERLRKALRFSADTTPARLRVREEVKRAQLSLLKRSVE